MKQAAPKYAKMNVRVKQGTANLQIFRRLFDCRVARWLPPFVSSLTSATLPEDLEIQSFHPICGRCYKTLLGGNLEKTKFLPCVKQQQGTFFKSNLPF